MKPRSCDRSSFSVKYRWPAFQILQLESSPSTHTSNRWASRRSRTATVRSETLKIRRTTVGCGSTADGGGWTFSSSNGRSNRSDIGELVDFVQAVIQALDLRRAAALIVRLDDDGVQARIARRGLEFLRQRRHEPGERRLDLNADDGIVR